MKRFYIDAGDDVVTFEHDGDTVKVTGSGLDNTMSKAARAGPLGAAHQAGRQGAR